MNEQEITVIFDMWGQRCQTTFDATSELDPLTLAVDTSSGPPSEAGTECLTCGAQPVYRVNWWYEIELQEMKRDDALREDPPQRTGILGNLAAGNFKEAMVGIAAMQAEINAILAED